MNTECDVSIIITIYNGQNWIDQCFESILAQNTNGQLKFEICVCNDASNDNTQSLLQKWTGIFRTQDIAMKVYHNRSENPRGVGYGKNRAVAISTGTYLCFQDIDDTMLPSRVSVQYRAATNLPDNVLIGSRFIRNPEGSTKRFTQWANFLNEKQLSEQIYTSNGPTVLMPTWFCHRNVFNRVGGFLETGKGTPEDLIFFYKHLDVGGKVHRANEPLVVYKYHPLNETFSIQQDTIWSIRVQRLQNNVLLHWKQFTIWNAGKQGRKLYNSLRLENREKVVAFCDVDVHKIGRTYVPYDPIKRTAGPNVYIIDYREANPPFVICVKLGLTNGSFESNLKSLNLEESKDYILFS